jgi:hypothetical protein
LYSKYTRALRGSRRRRRSRRTGNVVVEMQAY